MRTTIALVLALAIPTFASAQQADAVDADPTPVVQIEQSEIAPTTAPSAVTATEAAVGADVEVETRDAPVNDVAEMQEPGSRNWWWIVGAVVIGGLIVVLLT